MHESDNLYCKILVDSDLPKDQVVDTVSRMVSGTVDHGTIVTDWSEIDVVKNDDFDAVKRHKRPDGFLFYRYYLDMEPEARVLRQDYVNAIGKLLEGLWATGWKAVAACDFEDELPRKGGYGSESVLPG
jgi:hypothetical protein